jgi:hypothetical protein
MLEVEVEVALEQLARRPLGLAAPPLGVTQSLARLNRKGIRLYDTMPLPDYPVVATRH